MEKLELMEARRRQNEKIDRILEKFNEMEKKEWESMQRRRDIMEELSTSIKATTTVIMAASSSPPMAPSPSLPTNCSTECPYASSPNVTASSGHLDNEPSLAVSLHLSDGGDKDQTPYIVIKDLSNVTSAKCSTVGLDVNGGMEQVVVVFPTMKCIPKVVLISVEPMDIFLPRTDRDPPCVR
uniref:Uncharacterized protein n=1 Tax=Oryza meridionalis TaxID=40149 RepID=A0A0E0ECC5_9ORYZ